MRVRLQGSCIIAENQAETPLARILPPEIYAPEAEGLNIADSFSIIQRYQDLGNGLFCRLVRLTNHQNIPRQVRILLSAETEFAPTHWLIPCVMYNGNPSGRRNSPKGLTFEGQPWVFSYDRSGIPACTLSENGSRMLALFASDRDEASLRCSCSVQKLPDGRFRHQLIYPMTEAPVSYTGKNIMGKALINAHVLAPGASLELASYLLIDRPRWKNYGFYNLLTRALSVLRHDHLPAMETDMVRAVCLDYLKNTRHEQNGQALFSMSLRDYTHPIGNHQRGGPWDGLTLEDIERDPSRNRMMRAYGSLVMGFSAQGMMTLRMLLRDALETGNDQTREEILAILDGWAALQKPNGLVSISYPQERDQADPSNLGWGAGEIAKIYALLEAHGIQKPAYLRLARGICDFFAAHFDAQDPFGREWRISSGEKLQSGGCNGSFVLKAMLETYAVCGDRKYLDCAQKALDAYFRLELDDFRCSAGAIDCDSVDKESAFPFVYAGLALYRATGEKRYLARAEKAAAYFLSWMFCYDARYEPDSDFGRLGYFTAGGTVVSAEHQCIDPYAAVLVADLFDLTKETGNDLWQEAGRMIWANCTQCLAGPEGMTLHGMFRPAGAQNECFAQTRWSKYRASPEARGHLNDFIGSWLCCFKLYTLDRLGDVKQLEGNAEFAAKA